MIKLLCTASFARRNGTPNDACNTGRTTAITLAILGCTQASVTGSKILVSVTHRCWLVEAAVSADALEYFCDGLTGGKNLGKLFLCCGQEFAGHDAPLIGERAARRRRSAMECGDLAHPV
jgi:hypothetical protein